MGSGDSKLNYRQAVIELATKNINDFPESFWEQFWSPNNSLNKSNGQAVSVSIAEIFTLIPSAELRALKEEAPSNLTHFCLKLIDKMTICAPQLHENNSQIIIINCIRLLTRIIPYLLEDVDWRHFLWSSSYPIDDGDMTENNYIATNYATKLMETLIDILFIPEFTVGTNQSSLPEETSFETIEFDSYELIWEPGIGFAQHLPYKTKYDLNRMEILKLILVASSDVIYRNARIIDSSEHQWISILTSYDNRHALPLFTSLVNTIFSYNPSGVGIPYNHLLTTNTREPLVETCLQLLLVSLDYVNVTDDLISSSENVEGKSRTKSTDSDTVGTTTGSISKGPTDLAHHPNMFINYFSRIHREEDFQFLLDGYSRLLNNRLQQTYLPMSQHRISFHRELLILFWKMCDINKKFLFHVLQSQQLLSIVLPILYYIYENRLESANIGVVHLGIYILLLLSSERNFGVRLNKQYSAQKLPAQDLPNFTGTYGDLLIIIFYRLVTNSHKKVQELHDCLLTIIVNISPYLKSLTMIAATKLINLVEIFSNVNVLYSRPNAQHLVFFLLETINNIVQYQFDGNSNLIYNIIHKRNVFHHLSNLPTDEKTLKTVIQQIKSRSENTNESPNSQIRSSNKLLPKEQNMGLNHHDHRDWKPTPEWIMSWKCRLPLQTILRVLQILVPQVEKMCVDHGLTDESEILKYLQHGTLVGLLPVPHPILIRKYQPNTETNLWFRIFLWGIIYLRNVDPPIWYDTEIKLFDANKF
ncbi:hypothetical protein SNEBB_011458 [Seison nebaliae]|nr:hypothetical protein SNEBB_011458 [Seison nebaliae]